MLFGMNTEKPYGAFFNMKLFWNVSILHQTSELSLRLSVINFTFFSLALCKSRWPMKHVKWHDRSLPPAHCDNYQVAPWSQGTRHVLTVPLFRTGIPTVRDNSFSFSLSHWGRYIFFLSCCDKDCAIILQPAACLTLTILETGVGVNDCKCNKVQRLNVPSEARRS
jgi:hypothetical protein